MSQRQIIPSSLSSIVFSFEGFRFQSSTGELWPDGGTRILLRPQLASLLELLLRNPNSLVTRDEIQKHLWGDRVLDVDRGINFCVRQLRQTLGDEAKEPRFIETLPRQGYRFLKPVEIVKTELPNSPIRDEDTAASMDTLSRDPSRLPSTDDRPSAFNHRLSIAVGVSALILISLVPLWLSGSEQQCNGCSTTDTDPSAGDIIYAKGERQLHSGLIDLAVESFQQAIIHNPSDARAWGQLALLHMLVAADNPENFVHAEAALKRARELAPNLPMVHIRTGDLTALQQRDWRGAVVSYRRAVEIDPNNIEAHNSLGMVLTVLGRFGEAITHSNRAVEIDPLSLLVLQDAARIQASVGRWLEVRRLAKRILELNSESTTALLQLIDADLHLGLREEAGEAGRRLLPLLGQESDALDFEDDEDFDQLKTWFVERLLRRPGHRPRSVRAAILADLGRREEALAELEIMAESGTWILPFILRDPRFASLARSHRFALVLEVAGVEPAPNPIRIHFANEFSVIRGE